MASYGDATGLETEPDTGRGLSFAALGLGLLSLAAWIFFGLSVVTGALAVLLGIMARRKAALLGTGAGMATTGIVLGVLGILLGILYWTVLAELIAERIACRATPDAPACV